MAIDHKGTSTLGAEDTNLVTIADNASTDATWEIARALTATDASVRAVPGMPSRNGPFGIECD